MKYEPFDYVEKEGLTPEKRSELCIGCQWCCNYFIYTIARLMEPEGKYLSVRGVSVEAEDGMLYGVVPSRCPNLTEEGCAIYSKRPLTCKRGGGDADYIVRKHCAWYERKPKQR